MLGEDNETCSVPFQSPVTLGIFGATLSGKTTWCKKVLEQADALFMKPVNTILYCYGMYQPLFEELSSKLNNWAPLGPCDEIYTRNRRIYWLIWYKKSIISHHGDIISMCKVR